MISDIQKLKIYAINYVSCEKFSFSEKLQLIQKIEGANEKDLLELYMNETIQVPLQEFVGSAVTVVGTGIARITAHPIGQKVVRSLGGLATMKLLRRWPNWGDDIKNRFKASLGMQTDLDYRWRQATGPAKEALLKKIEAGKEHLIDLINTAGENPGTAIAVTAAVAAILTGGTMAYRRYMTKIGKACGGSNDKDKCRKEFRKKALQAQVNALKLSQNKCKESKKPNQCQLKIDNKVKALQLKISKIK